MEATALCIRLTVTVMILLSALHQNVGSVILRVDPNRLQFFEYESLTVRCEGPKGEQLSCRTARKLDSTGSSCIVQNAYLDESGEYWCETGAGKSSNSVNITVTAGSVVLESPALPVAEGDAVTLRCRNKTASSNTTADFYKDGLLISNSSAGSITVLRVSQADEGLYKCRLPDGGESAESRLTVGETAPSSSSAPWTAVPVLLMVLLLAVGLLHFGRACCHRAVLCLSTPTPGPDSAPDQAVVSSVSVEADAADADTVTYAVVTKKRKKKDEDALMSQALHCTVDPGDTHVNAEPSASTNPFYSTIS